MRQSASEICNADGWGGAETAAFPVGPPSAPSTGERVGSALERPVPPEGHP